nr:acetate kinase [Saccharomonospora xinjiangensis]
MGFVMRVLTVNPGSSSLKLSLVDGGVVTADEHIAEWDGVTRRELEEFAAAQPSVDAVSVRIVHGANRAAPTVLDEDVLADLHGQVPLAPLHQPRSLSLARQALDLPGRMPVVGCFDTAFHVGLPDQAATYPLPRSWRDRYGIRRYGFHGLSLAHATRAAAGVLGEPVGRLRLVCCHLGAGASVTAVVGGRSADTSMGFTPLDGVAMATRCGSIDPGIPLYLQREHGFAASDVEHALNHDSGLAGLSGTGGDVRDVLALRAEGDPDARLALDVYLHRLRREIAAQAVSAGKPDAVVLTGGVAEHQPELRAELFGGTLLGVRIDAARNRGAGDRLISEESSTPAVLVACREEKELARLCEEVLTGLAGAGPPVFRHGRKADP